MAALPVLKPPRAMNVEDHRGWWSEKICFGYSTFSQPREQHLLPEDSENDEVSCRSITIMAKTYLPATTRGFFYAILHIDEVATIGIWYRMLAFQLTVVDIFRDEIANRNRHSIWNWNFLCKNPKLCDVEDTYYIEYQGKFFCLADVVSQRYCQAPVYHYDRMVPPEKRLITRVRSKLYDPHCLSSPMKTSLRRVERKRVSIGK